MKLFVEISFGAKFQQCSIDLTAVSGELGLPDALDLYGKAGLYALADWHSAHTVGRANHLSEYEGVAELLLQDIKLRARHVAAASR